MKQLCFVFFFVFLLSSFSLSAQSTFERVMYNALGNGGVTVEKDGEARMAEPGIISLKTYYSIGDVKRVVFQVVSSNDVQTGTNNYYGRLRFGGLSANKVCIVTLTPGEIKKCIQLLTFAKQSVINYTSEEHQEIDFCNEYAFKIGVFKGSKEWKIFISSNYFVEDNQIQMSASEIDNLILIFQAMKNKIDELNQ